MCIQGERLLCELPSDKIIVDKEIWEVWFGVWTSIHLVYVGTPGKGIAMFGLTYI